MEVARGQYSGEDEEDADSRVQSKADYSEEEDLAQGTYERQDISNEIELAQLYIQPRLVSKATGKQLHKREPGRSKYLCGLGEQTSEVPNNRMESNVKPASN